MCLVGTGFLIYYSKSNNKLENNIESNNVDGSYVEDFWYQTYNYLSEEIRSSAEQSVPSASFVNDNTPKTMLDRSDTVAIISIISVDGVNSKINPAVGATYGKLVINNVLYGDLNSGDVVEYIKSGAIMSLAEWEEVQPEDARIKREEIRKKSGVDSSYLTDTYKQFHYASDPIVEDGKTYLAYLKYNDSVDKYEIIGRENGLRELNIAKQEKVSSKSYEIQDYTIKNNTTNEYEELGNYVSMNIDVVKE